MLATQTTAKELASIVGIAPRTKRYEALDRDGFTVFRDGAEFDAERWEHVLAAVRFARTEYMAISMRLYIVAVALNKCAVTGRMNLTLKRRVTEQYTPYQLCALIVKISDMFEGEPTIGELADFWINRHADQL